MSEKAQEVRKRRLESMAYLKKCAEIVFEFILNELDEKTSRKDYSSVDLYLFNSGTPYIGHGNDSKICDDVKIGFHYHSLFLEIIADMFNAEEGYTAIVGDGPIPELIVQIDFV